MTTNLTNTNDLEPIAISPAEALATGAYDLEPDDEPFWDGEYNTEFDDTIVTMTEAIADSVAELPQGQKARVEHITEVKASKYPNGSDYKTVLFKNGDFKAWQNYATDSPLLAALKIGLFVELFATETDWGADFWHYEIISPQPTGEEAIAYGQQPALESDDGKARYLKNLDYAGWAYRAAWDKAVEIFSGSELSEEGPRAIATTLMIQAFRHQS